MMALTIFEKITGGISHSHQACFGGVYRRAPYHIMIAAFNVLVPLTPPRLAIHTANNATNCLQVLLSPMTNGARIQLKYKVNSAFECSSCCCCNLQHNDAKPT